MITVKVIAYIDASYAVHADKKSHTGCIIKLGKGAVYGKSSTQKLNTTSSTVHSRPDSSTKNLGKDGMLGKLLG